MDGSSTRHVSAMDVGAVKAPTIWRSQSCKRSRRSVSDIAKSVFQVHGVDARRPGGLPPAVEAPHRPGVLPEARRRLVGIEACASSHHWSRELKALGHSVRLMPPAYVKPYVKRHKNDATDAEAICEAVTRAPEQQSCLVLHRDPPSNSSVSDRGDQCDPNPPCRVRHCCTGRASAVATCCRDRRGTSADRGKPEDICHPQSRGRPRRGWGRVTQACRAETLGDGRTRILPFPPACRALEEVGNKRELSAQRN